MKARIGSAGPPGLALLAAAGLVGVLLAAHGWAHRAAAGVPGSLGGRAATTQPPSARAPSTSATRAARPPTQAGPPGPAATTGPLLASEPFAPYSFVIWPGNPSATAKAALTGLSVNVRRVTSGLSVTADVNGQPASPAHVYANGARVYIVEATMGDDSGASDYNLGDDGIVVTDARGRIIA